MSLRDPARSPPHPCPTQTNRSHALAAESGAFVLHAAPQARSTGAKLGRACWQLKGLHCHQISCAARVGSLGEYGRLPSVHNRERV